MKTKITIISILAIALLSFSLGTKNASHSKSEGTKHSSETRVNKGLAMEDKNQFN